MEIEDDRTEAQKTTHAWLWIGTDDFMGRTGRKCGWIPRRGKSLAAWACTEGDLNACESWVRGRGDMKRVRLALAKSYRPKGNGYLHIYVFEK